MPSVQTLLFPLLLGVGLLAPGWLLGRALRTPAGLTGAFLGSAVILMNLLLVLDALEVTLNGPYVALGIALICGVLAVIAKFRVPNTVIVPTASWRAFRWHRHHWFLLPVAIGFAAIAVKAILDPLSGYDTLFRWDFLARQMLREGHLHFYPAIHADDFLHYSWCDGIAPLVSSLYFWSYLSLGKPVEWATTPIVLAQAVLLFWSVYKLASMRAGSAAGLAAVALLAACPILLWGVAMGQETGMTALSLITMFLFIEMYRKDPGASWLIWAGVAAGTGALAREYGLAYIGFGAVALLWQRVTKKGWLDFILTAALICFPWYLRNWLKTGNPLYSHDLAGIFPFNPIQAEYTRAVQNAMGLGTAAATPVYLVTLIGALAGVPLFFGLVRLISSPNQQIPWLVAIVGIITLWLWSINQTSGGVVYSLRVLTPAIALAASAGGFLLTTRLYSGKMRWVIVALVLVATDGALRSCFMPVAPLVNWWNTPIVAWREYRTTSEAWNNHPHWAAVANASEIRKIVVVDPYSHANLTRLGAHPVGIFSPAVSYLYTADLDFPSVLAQLRKDNVRFILISENRFLKPQLLQHSFFKALLPTTPALETPMFSLYDLYSETLLQKIASDAKSSQSSEPHQVNQTTLPTR